MTHFVRAATASDAEAINDISKYLDYAELPLSDAREKLRELLESPVDEVFVSEINGDIVAWLHLFCARRLASANFYEIGGLVVHPKFRGQGVGRSLVAYAQAQHAGEVRVRCNDLRRASHQFYQSIGFNTIKVQRVFQSP